MLLARFAGSPYPVPAGRVVVGPPIATGRMGVDALLVDRNRLNSVVAGARHHALGRGRGDRLGR